jgi:hypothetical protein
MRHWKKEEEKEKEEKERNSTIQSSVREVESRWKLG